MINSTWMLFCLVITVVIFGAGCSKTSPTVMELKHYPIENLEGLIAITDVVIDKEITSDGNGSLRITADQFIWRCGVNSQERENSFPGICHPQSAEPQIGLQRRLHSF